QRDDRARAVERVLFEPRLAGRVGDRDGAPGSAGGTGGDRATRRATPGARIVRTRARGPSVALLFGYAFLYLPIALLVAYSFNDSRLVTVRTGFSTRWYGQLAANQRIRDAAALSLAVAACAATLATVIGTFAGLAMARLGRFPARLLFAALLAAPLVMP